MDDIYKAPSSDLEENTDAQFSPHGFWKLFFWIHVVLTPLVLLVVVFEENISVYDYIDLSVFLFNLVVLFGYAFSKKIGVSSGLARPHILAGGNPARVTASHGPGIEPCSQRGNGLIDA